MRHVAIMERLSKLPRKMAAIRDHDVLTDCLLYELTDNSCLDCTHVAYFAYNPDFHICKGVSGLSTSELSEWEKDPWTNAHAFESHIRKTPLNTKIRNTNLKIEPHTKIDEIVDKTKHASGGSFSHSHAWDLHNGNKGIFLYTPRSESHEAHEQVPDAVCLLGFCSY